MDNSFKIFTGFWMVLTITSLTIIGYWLGQIAIILQTLIKKGE